MRTLMTPTSKMIERLTVPCLNRVPNADHLLPYQVWTRHMRNGIELPELARDDHYSTHFQEIRLYPKPVHVLPGRRISTELISMERSCKEVNFDYCIHQMNDFIRYSPM